jgi:hypothetical protein
MMKKRVEAWGMGRTQKNKIPNTKHQTQNKSRSTEFKRNKNMSAF